MPAPPPPVSIGQIWQAATPGVMVPLIVGMFFSEYVAAFDRIVKHAKVIALVEKQPYFWIKRKKLERLAEEAEYTPPPLTNAQDFLDRLHSEDYL